MAQHQHDENCKPHTRRTQSEMNVRLCIMFMNKFIIVPILFNAGNGAVVTLSLVKPKNPNEA